MPRKTVNPTQERGKTPSQPRATDTELHTSPGQTTPAIKPPGRVLTGGHGPQSGVRILDGPARLRQVLNLSATCDINQACEDAAVEIERLRRQAQQPPRPWTRDLAGSRLYV